MPRVRWTRGFGARVIGGYRWDEGSGWECYVHPADALEVLTNPDFLLVGRDDLAVLEDVDPQRRRDLESEAGVFSFEDLLNADPDLVAAALRVDVELVESWRAYARRELAAGEAA